MRPVGFEPTIPAGELPQTHALDRAATGTGLENVLRKGNKGPHILNPLKPELNPICYLLALLGAHHFLHVSRIRVKLLTLR